MDADKAIDTIIVVHSETSTTARTDVEGIARLARERDAILIVDGITAVGAIPVKMDEWGVDAYITGSQKAVMLPPGLAFVAVSDRAWSRIDSGKMPVLYNDLRAYRKSLDTWDAPYTPAATIMRGAQMVLRGIKERTLENVWAETATLAAATRASVEAMNLKTYATDPVDSVTAICVPEKVDEAALRKTMRSRFGFQIAGGQGKLKGNIVRLSHMGYLDAFDTLGALAALEICFKEQGHDLAIGAGITAAQKVFAERL